MKVLKFSFLILFTMALFVQLQASPVKSISFSKAWSSPELLFSEIKAPAKSKSYNYIQTENYAYTEYGDWYYTDFYDVGISFLTPHTDNVIVEFRVTTYYALSSYSETLYIPVAAYVNSWNLRTLGMYQATYSESQLFYKIATIVDVYPG